MGAVKIQVSKAHKEVLAYINREDWIDCHLTEDEDLTSHLASIDDNVETLAERLGLEVRYKDNVCNHDNDFDTGFYFTVISNKEEWYYGNGDTYIVLCKHLGGDLRGNYSSPVVYQLDSDSFLDWVVGVQFYSGIGSDGSPLETEQVQALDACYQVGYSRNPSYEFHKEIKEVLEGADDTNTFTVLLKSGETVTGGFYWRNNNGGFNT